MMNGGSDCVGASAVSDGNFRNAWATAFRSLEALMADFRDRIIPPVMNLAATKLLLHLELPDALPSPLNAVCRGLARHVALLAGIDVPAGDATPLGKQSPPAVRAGAPTIATEQRALEHAT